MAYFLTDPRDYGTLGVIISMITLARVFLSAGMPQAVSRFIAHEEERAGTIYRQGVKIQLVGASIVAIIYIGGIPLWSFLLNDKSLASYILLSSLLIPLMGWYQINLAYFNGKRKFGQQAFFTGMYSFSRFILALILVLLGMKVYGVILGFVLAVFSVLIMTKLAIPRQENIFNYDSMKLVKFAAPIVFLSLGISLLLNLDILLLKHFFSDSPIIGFYNGAMNLGKAPYFVFSAFALTVLPTVTKAFSDNDREKAKSLVSRNISFLLLLSIPTATMVLATSEKVLDFIYPSTYIAGSEALKILIVSMSGLALFSSLTSIITARGHPAVSMSIVLLCIPVQIGLGLYLIPKFEMIGTAYANLITVSLGVTIAGVLVYKYFGILFDTHRIVKTLLASFILYCLLIYYTAYPLIALPLVYGAAFLLFFVIMLITGGVTKNDLLFLENFIPGKIKK
jgi:O-antigen/teichoic acid export membrane protein